MTRENLFALFFFVALVFLLTQLYLVLSPFATPLILAGVLAVGFSPLTALVRRAVGGSRARTALVMMLVVLVAAFAPAIALVSVLADQATTAREAVESLLAQGGSLPDLDTLEADLSRRIRRLPGLASFDLASVTLEASKGVAVWIEGEISVLAASIVLTVFNGVMMFFALFFFFRDGDRIDAAIRRLLPMEEQYKDRIAGRLFDTVTAVVQSTLLVGILQGILAGLGYAFIGGLGLSVMLGFLTGVASLVPVIGATLVWLPAAVFLLATGEIWQGIGLVAWGIVVVGSVDNFVRPLVIGGRVEMPTVLLLFALLGGIQVYGALGVILAPVVVGVLLAFLEIYHEIYVETPAVQDPEA